MTPQKPPAKNGLLPKLKRFWDALGDRYQRALQVIDEALDSDSLKDKIWAVDLILKKTSSANSKPEQSTLPEEPILDPSTLKNMSDTELLAKIRTYLDQEQP